jgi:DNA-binding PadR family transcriptional regulator
MTNWKLGTNQREVLRSLRDHSGWPGNWYWGSTSLTIRILDSLVGRSLVAKIDVAIPELAPTRYEITDAGREALEALGGIYADPKKPKTEAERIACLSTRALRQEFAVTMDKIREAVPGPTSFAELGDLLAIAGRLWHEIVGRGIEYR